MKAREIIFLTLNSIFGILSIVFAFTKTFIERQELKYSINMGAGLFELNNSVWAVFSKITLIVLLGLLVALIVLYVLERIKKDKKLFKTLFILSIATLCVIALFIIFASATCLDKNVFGFGVTKEYKFNATMYVFLVLGTLEVLNMFFHCLDNLEKYK